MADSELRQTFDQFVARTLPKPQWTHEAHLAVCWYTLQQRGAAEAIAYLRGAITAYNESVGTANTTSDGYHETLTRFYVNLADAVGAASPEALVADARCSRQSPLDYWSRGALFSVAARLGWLEPDVAALPWVSSAAAYAHHLLTDAVAGELELLLPSVRADARALDRLLHVDFVEVGASGRLWTRDEIIGDLVSQSARPAPAVDELTASRLDDGTILVTYRTTTDERVVRRSSTWMRTPRGWQVRYHQGTVVPLEVGPTR